MTRLRLAHSKPDRGHTVTVETKRLLLRPPRLADIRALFTFLGDRRAMRHTQVYASLRECRRRIGVHELFRRKDGCAPWSIVTKQDGRIVGWGGLYNDPFDRGWGVEVAYRFHSAAWGNGYASELVAACVDIAGRELALPEIKAFARPQNAASCRVLEKAGFDIVCFVPAMDRLLFRRPLKAPERSR